MQMNNIIYQDSSIGIIMRALPAENVATFDAEKEHYSIRLQRCGDTEFRIIDAPKKVHPWQHKLIMKTFKRIGYDLKIRVPKMKIPYKVYSMTNKKQKFQFLLKYGMHTY